MAIRIFVLRLIFSREICPRRAYMASELAEENRYERQELGVVVDAARVSVRYNSNVNYYTVRLR